MAQVLQVADFEIIRGDTWRSPKFSFFNEDIIEILGPDFTQEEIDEAIKEGTLTFRNWKDYEITSDVKLGGAGGSFWFTLTDYKRISDGRPGETDGRFLWFEMTPQETRGLEGLVGGEELPIRGLYDIQFCKSGEVFTIWGGGVVLKADITDRTEVCQ